MTAIFVGFVFCAECRKPMTVEPNRQVWVVPICPTCREQRRVRMAAWAAQK
jgi:hypothetical protein